MAKKKKRTVSRQPEPVAEPKLDVVANDVAEESENGNLVAAIIPRSDDDRLWLAGAVLITIVSGILRFYWLALKPLHHDEGVNGFFLKNLFNDGIYKYDPANYHGPTLYYLSIVFAKVFGLETVPVRFSVAIFGVLMVVLALYLKRYLGRLGSLAAALFLALSPGMVYISRYFIHEILFVFLSLAVVVAVVYFIEKRSAGIGATIWMSLILFVSFMPSTINFAGYLGGGNPGAVWAIRVGFLLIQLALVYYLMRMLLAWDNGRPIYLLLASASVALLFATKETTFITLGTMLIACGCVWIWHGITSGKAYATNWQKLAIGFHVALAVFALYQRETVMDGFRWMNETFFSHFRPHEPFVYSAILFMIAASFLAWGLYIFSHKHGDGAEFEEPVGLTWPNFRKALGERTDLILILVASAAVFIYLSVLFFSSFFTYMEGVGKAFEAYAIWTKTGNKDHTQNGYFAYVKWGMKVEAPIMILSTLGVFIAMLKAKHRLAMFTALWAIGVFAAYTIIPYKTPWLALSFLLPMCLIAGYAIGQLLTSKDKKIVYCGGALVIVASAVLTYQTYQHNFVRYADDDMSYVYAHTRAGFHDLIDKIDHYAAKSGQGNGATIEIVSSDYWPMTWYLNKYGRANFHGNLVDANTAEMIVAKKDAQDTAIIQRYGTHYKMDGVYPLRPGVNLVLLVRNDLADTDAKDVSKVTEYKTIPGYTQ